MEKSKIERLKTLIKLQELIQEELQTDYDEYFRSLTNDEIKELESKYDINITRTNKHSYKYSKEYKDAQKELKEKYPVKTTTIENYYIKYTTTSHIAQNKAEIILQQLATQSKTQLERVASKITKG